MTSASQIERTRHEESFREGQVDTIHKVLDMIDKTAAKREKEGFGNAYKFTRGVMNCILMAFIFAMYPEHFWILYVVEGCYLFPFKIYLDYNAKPLSELLYHLDYCWMMNTLGIGVFALLGFVRELEVTHEITEEEGHSLRKHAFLAFVGVNGVLMGATALLPFVAVFFHNVRAMAGLFIHLFPPLLCYTFLWNASVIKEAWPRVFDLSYMDELQFFPTKDDGSVSLFFLPGTALGTVAGNTVALYYMWFIPYVCWMLLHGLDLPRQDGNRKPVWDTVFHSTVRKGLCISFGKIFWGRSSQVSRKQMKDDHYEVRDFLVYMGLHALFATLAIYLIAYPCYRSQTFHKLSLLLLTTLCVHRGAIRYRYYITDMYGNSLRKEFAHLLDKQK